MARYVTLTEERRVALLDVSAGDACARRIAQLAPRSEERVHFVTEVEVGSTQQTLTAATLAHFRLVREHDEVVEAVRHEEAQTRVVDEERHSIHFQRLDVLKIKTTLTD